METLTFDQLLERVEALPMESQETLVDVIRSRLRDRRRAEIARHAEEARELLAQGKLRGGTEEDLMRDLEEFSE